MLGQQIDNLALALIAPVHADHAGMSQAFEVHDLSGLKHCLRINFLNKRVTPISKS